MKLLEKEVKDLLEEYGLETPERGYRGSKGHVVKAQVLAKNRNQKGGIKFAEGEQEAQDLSEQLQGMSIDGQDVEEVLVEKQVDIESEYYVSFLYDTDTRMPVMLFSREGGSGVEDRNISKLELPSNDQWRYRQFLSDRGISSSDLLGLSSALEKAARCFFQEDCRMLEINPLAKTSEGFVALDAMADLDDDASYRHSRDYPERSDLGREKTERERRAEKIDEDDHRGIAGKYTELDGDIGMMLAGGGASLTNMDALIASGGEPANYTEYGGNPPTEKVYRLSKVIISKELDGLWHVGGTANNTDIYRTMKGFCQALEEEEPDYPIVVRRDGPNADRAFELLHEKKKELELDMDLFRNDTPMTETAENLMEKVEKFREAKK